jgi:light-regulated signal transduction histidine kinase (bacteriophytochrome)
VVSVAIAPGLSVHADAHLTTVLLEKLLGNAWKFTSRKPQATIELGREPGEEVHTLFVADDGAGFDMAAAGRLFSPFQRLHHASEFDGTGMGLAIAHRIVARHGGRIWARAEPGKGARFHWTVAGPTGAPERP